MKKELTLLGLGRMGCAMGAHLVEQGFTVHGFAPGEESRKNATAAGVTVHDTTEAAVNAQTDGERLVWVMVPSKVVDDVLDELCTLLKPGDCVIDGGNNYYKDSIARGQKLSTHKINFIDSGVSGGIEGARHGASLMVGGEEAVVQKYEHIFKALATENGYGHIGKQGAGHYVKMVHNAIEYGMMAALAEGLSLVESKSNEFDIRMDGVLDAYENGSIITSSLMSWLADAYRTPGYLAAIAGEVPRGETEYEMEHLEENETLPILTAALEQRRATRKSPNREGTLISAMRNQFGGHKTIEKHDS